MRNPAELLRRHSDIESCARAEAAVCGRFDFLNHSELLPSIDWGKTYVNPLWTYNLHYFDYAVDLANAYLDTRDSRFATGLEELITGWIHSTSSGNGPGWEPYPTSVRITNWIFAILLLGDALRRPFSDLLTQSLFRQLSHLERRLEWHLLANHLQKNLVALWMGGLAFKGAAAKRWRTNASRLLWKQIQLQVLTDGGHAERTPMYHAIAMRDLLEVVHLSRAVGMSVPDEALIRVEAMVPAFLPFVREDDTLHLFNDAAQGVAPPLSRLRHLASVTLGIAIDPVECAWSLPETGFYGFRDPECGDTLVIDCGSPGPLHQPGHSHCGILSYELDLGGVPVIVDSGVHGYDGDRFREYVRSTRAHNTVSVNGREQSEMWGTFRVGRRARVVHARAALSEGKYVFEGTYIPYHSRKTFHSRKFVRSAEALEVIDAISGKPTTIDSFIHLHPDMSAAVQDGIVVVQGHGLKIRIEPFGIESLTLEKGGEAPIQGWYCPEFGKAIPQPVVAMRINNRQCSPFGYRILVDSRDE